MIIAQQIIFTTTFPLHHRHQRHILHKICHVQQFVKLKLAKKFSWGPRFSKMLKLSDFSGLENGRLRCVRIIVSGAKSLSLKCFSEAVFPEYNHFCPNTMTLPEQNDNTLLTQHSFWN